MNPKKKLLFFILLFCLGAIVSIRFLPKNESSEALKNKFWALKVHNNEKRNVVIYGDSRVYRGVSVQQLLENTGMTGVNLGFPAGGFNKEMYTFIDSRLDYTANKKYIILGITANAFTLKSTENGQYTQEKNRGIYDRFERVVLAPILNFFDPFEPYDLYNKLKGKKDGYYETFHDDGWVESYKIPEDSTSALKDYINNFNANTVNDSLMESFLKQVNIWSLKGINVYGFVPPITKAMREVERKYGYFNIENFKERFIAAGGKWIDINADEYKSYDGSHLNGDNAKKLSRSLSQSIFR